MQPYSRSRSLPRHLERGERWQEGREERQEYWQASTLGREREGRSASREHLERRSAGREELGRRGSREDVVERRGWREEPRDELRGGQSEPRSWREEVEEQAGRAEAERSWKMRRRSEMGRGTPVVGRREEQRKSSDSSAPETVLSSLHSVQSGKMVTIAPQVRLLLLLLTLLLLLLFLLQFLLLLLLLLLVLLLLCQVEIIPRASLGKRLPSGEVMVNSVRLGPSLGRRAEHATNFLSDTEASEAASPPVPAPVYPTLPLRCCSCSSFTPCLLGPGRRMPRSP